MIKQGFESWCGPATAMHTHRHTSKRQATVPQIVWVLKPTKPFWCAQGCEAGPTVYHPYPRRLETLTFCRYHYKRSNFSSGHLTESTFSVGTAREWTCGLLLGMRTCWTRERENKSHSQWETSSRHVSGIDTSFICHQPQPEHTMMTRAAEKQ